MYHIQPCIEQNVTDIFQSARSDVALPTIPPEDELQPGKQATTHLEDQHHHQHKRRASSKLYPDKGAATVLHRLPQKPSWML